MEQDPEVDKINLDDVSSDEGNISDQEAEEWSSLHLVESPRYY